MSRVFYGGQAVLEGVMMRGPRDMAVAVRAPNGQIVIQSEDLSKSKAPSRWAKMPFIRGSIVLWDQMALGMRALMFSADVAAREESDDPNARPAQETGMPKGVLWGTMAFSLLLAVGLFFVTPVLIMGYLDQFLQSSLLSNLIEKLIRLLLILGYIGGIAFLPEIKRTYAYHGAEHKTVNAHEAGRPLTVEEVRQCSTIHPRCGTTFLIVVVVVSFILFAMLGQPPMLLRIASRIILIPIVAGIAYELVRYAASHYEKGWIRAIMAPGLAVQKLTTREPDDNMLETAIVALKTVFAAEEARVAAPSAASDTQKSSERVAVA